MSGPCRVGAGFGVDASRLLHFTFDGRRVAAHPGDTVASALLAQGTHLMGRSFKYHRPRGVLGAGSEEPNALVGVDRGAGRFEPNQRATMVQVAEGLVVESQNRHPSLRWDLGAVNDFVAPMIPAGFYYKTFMWPRSFWARVYEPRIRSAAGLGRAPTKPDPDRYGQRWAHAESLIVGGGPAGLSAALAAGARGGRVILCDEAETLGGALALETETTVDGLTAIDWIARARATLATMGNVQILTRTTAFGYGVGNLVALAQRCDDSGTATRERLWLVRAGRVILATGAIERPIVFPNNDRPGIMLASAARTYMRRYGVLVGRRVAVVVSHDSGYRAGFELAAAGARVTMIDSRPEVAADLSARAVALGVAIVPGRIPLDTRGRLRVKALAVGRDVHARRQWLACDAVAMAGGWTPSVHLYSQSGGKVAWDDMLEAFVPSAAVQPQASVGACAGELELQGCLAAGWSAGSGEGDGPVAEGERADRGAFDMAPAPHREGARRKAFVDFQNDVTARDVRLAVREGFRSVEHLKRYTTTGMATDQGRTSNINAMAIAAQALGQSVPAMGLTTFRAPFSPVTFGTMTGFARGPLFDPVRTTPLHARAVEAGAVFEDVGQWKRARYFHSSPNEAMADAVRRECLAVRSSVGLFDASTLGKIEVVGPDAAVFLDFILTGRPSTLEVGRCRYGLMLREDGFIYDDGVTGRLAADRFHVTTTSGGAANVLALMEDFRQTELPHLRVWLTSTTEQWAVIAVNGPKARAVVASLVEGTSLETEAFPHMAIREARIGDIPVRLFRVSFTGEHGYEVNVPASRALEVWDAIVSAGAVHGATLYGTEAAHVLRAEKGYIIVGHETDGTVIPADVGLGKMVAMSKPDFVGKRSLMRAAMLVPERKQLVALLPIDNQLIDEGAQVIDPAEPGRAIGHVSSTYDSAALGRPFALALVSAGRDRIGARLGVADAAGYIAAHVADPVLFDREGARLDA